MLVAATGASLLVCLFTEGTDVLVLASDSATSIVDEGKTKKRMRTLPVSVSEAESEHLVSFASRSRKRSARRRARCSRAERCGLCCSNPAEDKQCHDAETMNESNRDKSNTVASVAVVEQERGGGDVCE